MFLLHGVSFWEASWQGNKRGAEDNGRNTEGCKARINGSVVVVVSLMTHDGRLMNDELSKWMHHFHLYSVSLLHCLSGLLFSASLLLIVTFICFLSSLFCISFAFPIFFLLPSFPFSLFFFNFLHHSPLIFLFPFLC